MIFNTIYTNDNLSRIYVATKTCVRGEIKEETELRLKTIKNSVGRGHESVLEHSNVIMCFTFNEKEMKDPRVINALLDILECCKYINYRRYTREDNHVVFIFAGSIRGYKHIFRTIKDMNNPILERIKSCLYTETLADYYQDFIKDNIMDPNKFPVAIYPRAKIFYDNNEADAVEIKCPLKLRQIEVLDYDNIRNIQEDILASTHVLVPFEDLLDFCTIQIRFNHISRTASHQLVRHRNAISQESQRYVNYSGATFINPEYEDMKAKHRDKLDIRGNLACTGDSSDKFMIELNSIAKDLVSKYESLVSRGMKKENARAILPNNIETTLIMTFTYSNLFKAIELRTDPAAQSEIRNLFNDIYDILTNYILYFEKKEDMYEYICTTRENHYRSQINGDSSSILYIEEPTNEINEYEESLDEEETKELVNQMNTELGVDLKEIYDPEKSLPKQVSPLEANNSSEDI